MRRVIVGSVGFISSLICIVHLIGQQWSIGLGMSLLMAGAVMGGSIAFLSANKLD